jgi:hypothetical protein
MEHQDVPGYVVCSQPPAFEVVEWAILHPGCMMTAGPDGQPAEGTGHITEGNPAGEHVLHGPIVLVDETSRLSRHQFGRVDDPGDLQGIAEPTRAEKLAHQICQW